MTAQRTEEEEVCFGSLTLPVSGLKANSQCALKQHGNEMQHTIPLTFPALL